MSPGTAWQPAVDTHIPSIQLRINPRFALSLPWRILAQLPLKYMLATQQKRAKKMVSICPKDYAKL